MELNQVKRIAAAVLGIGVNKVRIKDREKATQAMTRDDVRSLIRQGAITKKPLRGVSRVRARKIAAQKKKGRRKGPGKRRGSEKSRLGKKEKWMRKIRALRRALRKEKGELDEGIYRKLYNMSKGGYFRSKSHLHMYIEEKGMKKETKEKK